MDVLAFLKMRTDFITYYYSTAVGPFCNIQNSINDQTPPFDDPPYDESGEPAFLVEWLDADLGKEMVGFHCISLLSESMKVYFSELPTLVRGFEFESQKPFRKGFLNPYLTALSKHLGIDWQLERIDFDTIEQIVLARNNVSHAQSLTDLNPRHDDKTLYKYPRPFFSEDISAQLYEDTKTFGKFAMKPKVTVTEAKLLEAIEAILEMAQIVDKKMYSRGPPLHA